ncbi:MAG: hypothetical protein KGV51_08915 [Moraxellaceae bacterium]|nr:hypothetical protein [Moraxellaceae bacterium]
MATDNKQNNHSTKEQASAFKASDIISSKYSGIAIILFLFLLITLSILSYNYIISNKIIQLSKSADVVARQEVLVQTLAKEVMDIELLNKQKGLQQGDPISDDIILASKKLEKSVQLFDKTLNAFAEGGEVINDAGETIEINKMSDELGGKSIENAQMLWQPYKRLIESYLISVKKKNINAESIRFASDYARIFNGKLFQEMNDLEQTLVNQANEQNEAIKRKQLIGLLSVILLFIYSIFRLLPRLIQKTDNYPRTKAIKTQKQVANNFSPLTSVKEGSFLIDKNLVIAEEYSQILEDFFNQKNLAGKKLTDILSTRIGKKDLKKTKTFIDQLYSDSVLEELNPLNRIRVHKATDKDKSTESYLSFQFIPMYERHQILVHVYDVTEQALLERQLDKEKNQSTKLLEMLERVIHSDSKLLQDFVETTFNHIDTINNILKTKGNHLTKLHNKIDEISHEISNIEADAISVKLERFVELTKDIEYELQALLKKPNLVGNDFLGLTIYLDELLKLTIFVDTLTVNNQVEVIEKPVIENTVNNTYLEPSINMEEYYSQFAQEIAQSHGKEISFQCIGMDNIALTLQQNNLLQEICLQLLSNSIIHGIELPDKREKNNKARAGKLTLSLEDNNGILVLSMADDGQGINYDKIRQTALESGKYNPEVVESWTEKDLLQLLFITGFSTSETQDGNGMDIIRDLVKQLGGRLKIGSEKNLYSRFTITFPRQQ